jgi:hypothetical protein
MSRHPSLFQSLLDKSSSYDDDELILSAVEIVQNHLQPTRKYGGCVLGMQSYIRIEKEGT